MKYLAYECSTVIMTTKIAVLDKGENEHKCISLTSKLPP